MLSTRSMRICVRPLSARSFTSTSRASIPRVARTVAEKTTLDRIPSFREQVARTSIIKPFSEQIQRPSIRNQVIFFSLCSLVAFQLAAEKTNVDTAELSKKLTSFWRTDAPTSEEMMRVRYFDLGKKLQVDLARLRDALSGWPIALKNVVLMGYVKIAQPYLDSPEGQRMCWTICAVNGAVWLAWKIPRFTRGMSRSFMHHPLSGLSYTLLTSTFSHKSFLHLLFNCMALSSFGSAAAMYLAREHRHHSEFPEATPKWHFLSFYISAGLFSGLVSHVVAARFRFPRLVAQLSTSPKPAAASAVTAGTAALATTKAATHGASDILPSLGASGAIYASVTMTALAFPDTMIALLIPPSFPIPITWGVGGLVLIDCIGVLRGWRMFDHWAHLGGAAFGALYWAYGPQWWATMRDGSRLMQKASDPHRSL